MSKNKRFKNHYLTKEAYLKISNECTNIIIETITKTLRNNPELTIQDLNVSYYLNDFPIMIFFEDGKKLYDYTDSLYCSGSIRSGKSMTMELLEEQYNKLEEEINRLHKENKKLKTENAMLKKHFILLWGYIE